MLLVEREAGHFQQCHRLLDVQAQGLVEILLGLVGTLHAQGRQAEVLEHSGTLGIEAVFRCFLETLEGFLIALLLEEESAVVVENPRITAGRERLAVVLVGQLGLHLGLENQGQRSVGIRAGGVKFEGLAQRNLCTLRSPLLQVAEAQLDVGIPGLFTPLRGPHRVHRTGGYAASQASEYENERSAQGHGVPPFSFDWRRSGRRPHRYRADAGRCNAHCGGYGP